MHRITRPLTVVTLAAIIMLVSVVLIVFSEWLRRVGTHPSQKA